MKYDESLIDSLEEQEVIYYVYSYYDPLTKLFNQPLIVESDPRMVAAGAKASYVKDEQARIKLTGLKLCVLGTFECRKGTFYLNDEPTVILDFERINLEVSKDA